jgi:hypothetical protein
MRDADEDGWGDDLSTECCYTLEVADSYNGIWDAGYLSAYSDGVLVGTYAAEGGISGATESYVICTGDGEALTLEYTAGSYEIENSYVLKGPDGTELHADGPTPSPGLAVGHELFFSSYPSCFQGEPGGDCDDDDGYFNLDDLDGDLVSTCADDCDDGDSGLGDIALDADCDGSLAEEHGGDDCDDDDGDRSPAFEEVCDDGIDNDCDGSDRPCWEGPAVFTNCGQTGYTGPSQGQCDGEYSGTDLAGEVTLSGGIQQWTVPVSGDFVIEVLGAEGGSANKSYSGDHAQRGGKGSRMSGTFSLIEGEVLDILVGQRGFHGDGGCGDTDTGGGGGTFVVDSNGIPLLIAGGGGGGSYYGYDSSSKHGHTSGTGQPGYSCSSTGGNGDHGSYCGDNSNTGAPGAGIYSGSGTSFYNSQTAGDAFVAGGQGGRGSSVYSTRPDGGFGGGGGGAHGCCYGSGGGGGYSGGTGGDDCGYGGGGGSYNDGADQDNESGYNTGHGQVSITLAD